MKLFSLRGGDFLCHWKKNFFLWGGEEKGAADGFEGRFTERAHQTSERRKGRRGDR